MRKTGIHNDDLETWSGIESRIRPQWIRCFNEPKGSQSTTKVVSISNLNSKNLTSEIHCLRWHYCSFVIPTTKSRWVVAKNKLDLVIY